MAKILLIDDSIFTLNHYAEMLEKMGHRVLTAEGGEEGIRLFRAEQPDLVFCDLMMPEMDGFEVFEEIKKGATKLNFFFVTADIQEHTRKKAMQLGAKGLVPKPLTEKMLHEVLKPYGA